MPYSMLNATALGFDLVRRPSGDRAASVVRTALACDPPALVRLAARCPQRQPRAHAWSDPARVVDTVAVAGRALELAEAGQAARSAVELQRLEAATLGGIDTLERFLRDDVLGWAFEPGAGVSTDVADGAVRVLFDAAAAAFSDGLSPAQQRRLGAPFVGARVTVRDAHVGTSHPEVDALLTEIARSGPDERRAWREAAAAHRPDPTSWAPAFHETCWAAHLSGRVRLAADAQLAAALAFRAGGFDTRDAAHGVWNAVSGAVQAHVTADLLDSTHHDVLVRPLRLVQLAC